MRGSRSALTRSRRSGRTLEMKTSLSENGKDKLGLLIVCTSKKFYLFNLNTEKDSKLNL